MDITNDIAAVQSRIAEITGAPPAQSAFAQYTQAGCKGKRATPDLSAIADPATGVLVYSSTPYQGMTGWWKVGGTSLAAPVVTAISVATAVTLNATTIYGATISWRDVNSLPKAPTNGATCLTGFDLCTGRGAWLTATATPSK